MLPTAKFWGRFCLLLVLLICAFAVWGQTEGTGLVCDTKEQVKEVITEKRVKPDESCGVLNVLYNIVSTEVFVFKNEEYLIAEISVVGVNLGNMWVPAIPPLKQYTVFKKPKPKGWVDA